MEGKGPMGRRPPARPERSGRHRRLYLVPGRTTPTLLDIDVDTGTAPQLATALSPLERRCCELDLARMPFMDFAGLTLLLDPCR